MKKYLFFKILSKHIGYIAEHYEFKTRFPEGGFGLNIFTRIGNFYREYKSSIYNNIKN